MLERYLDDLEGRIDPAVEEELHADWLAFTEGRFDGDIFTAKRSKLSPPGIEWPDVSVNAAIADFEKMALREFTSCSKDLADGGGRLMCVRSNYGTSIMPSMFGVELFWMDEELDVLPTSWPVDNLDRIREIVETGPPDMAEVAASDSLAGRTLRMAGRFAKIKATYPKIGRWIHFYHPDLQGPTDVCEVIWGSCMFVDVVDHPELVTAMLELLTETYERLLARWAHILPFPDGPQGHWGMMHAGKIMLRDDSAMNLSPAMFERFIKPYDQRLLDAFGGGAIHFCGKGDHYIESMCRMSGMHAIAMSQPEYNDMEVIYRSTVDRGIKLIGFRRAAAEEALADGRDLHGCVHCW
jgi:hypothetical protein